MKPYVDLKSSINRAQARKLLSEFFNKNPDHVTFSRHAEMRMMERGLGTTDIVNVLRRGKILREPEEVNGSWRYRIETNRIAVIFVFRRPDFIRIITAMRISK